MTHGLRLVCIRLSVVAAGLALLAGCASSPESSTAAGPGFVGAEAPFSLPASATTRAELGRGSPVNPGDGTHYRVFSIDLEAEQLLLLAGRSDDFGPTLTLYGPDGTHLERVSGVDDWGYQSDEARLLRRTVSAGTYTLVVSANQPGQTGVFEIESSLLEETRPAALEADGVLNDVMTDLRQPVPGATGVTGNPHALSTDEPIVLDLQMVSTDLDPYLYITNAEGVIVGEDDDSAGSLNARLLMPLEPGEYTVWASSFSESGRGDYRLLTEAHQPDEFEGTFIGDYILGDSQPSGGLSGSTGCGCSHDW